MEEVWKDISLASLNEHPNPAADSIISTRTNNPNYPGMNFLDFLAGPINNNNETPSPRTSRASNHTPLAQGTALLGSSQTPTPGTLLSLNSGLGFQYVQSGDPMTMRPNPAVDTRTTGSSHNFTFNGFAYSPNKKRNKMVLESNENSNDRRDKRMMKNRESAARSRARKQAYINDLELEVAFLQEENAKLRWQQQKLLSATNRLPKKNSLSRTLTAPF